MQIFSDQIWRRIERMDTTRIRSVSATQTKERATVTERAPPESGNDWDFIGGLAFKDVFLCKVNKFVDIEKVTFNLNKGNIPFENVTYETRSFWCANIWPHIWGHMLDHIKPIKWPI